MFPSKPCHARLFLLVPGDIHEPWDGDKRDDEKNHRHFLQVFGVHSGGKRHSVNAGGEDIADESRRNQQPHGDAAFRPVNQRIQQVLQADVLDAVADAKHRENGADGKDNGMIPGRKQQENTDEADDPADRQRQTETRLFHPPGGNGGHDHGHNRQRKRRDSGSPRNRRPRPIAETSACLAAWKRRSASP